MIDYKKVYEEWLNNEFFDENTRKDLLSIKSIFNFFFIIFY